MTTESDREYRATTVIGVRDEGESGWSITDADGWSFWIPKDKDVEPKVGQVARFYGRGIGYIVRGLTLDGQVVFYRTDEEQHEKQRQEKEEQDVKSRTSYAEHRTTLDARIAALPGPFQQRLHRFRSTSPDWGWQHEEYELFSCEEAVKIASLGSLDALKEFHSLPYEEQVKRAGISDGHSGNTFDVAFGLARLYIDKPELVRQAHGAMCPIVGCKDYGCYAAEAVPS